MRQEVFSLKSKYRADVQISKAWTEAKQSIVHICHRNLIKPTQTDISYPALYQIINVLKSDMSI